MSSTATADEIRGLSGYVVRQAEPGDIADARSVMLDTVYRDFGHGYLPQWHADIIDVESFYLAPEDNALFVAERGGRVVATAGVRGQTPTSPPHPPEVADRFEEGRTASLYRVYVRPEHRRRGLAGALVDACLDFAASRERYTGVYLHTDARTPGAVEFWSRRGAVLFDERVAVNEHRGDAGEPFETVHFRLRLPR
ncbi:Acetyltransferase (GNAT) family protein [Glycomyces sambucus]|uniref:Acetyltransferase (GNAT) family protein n=1 Tax=Glycomyces sambucus TaxID=380244 RepID=A0A1G9KWU1_9ACTN|nr:GNAT family N-acetyltransferase [Glycomyces sambucus]SDL53927.1 Acetyltransferase (GNAT) family protein [Glycomyces sambucus]